MNSNPAVAKDATRIGLELFGSRLLDSTSSGNDVRWPEERMQLNYTGASGSELMRRTIDFVELLARNISTLASADLRGLDYGVGWGRIASLMGYFGSAISLDCADAWQKSLDLARQCGLRNEMKLVSAYLQAGEVPADTYDFIYSYSIFTHLPETHIVNNAAMLVDALKPGGKLVLTLRESKFIEFLQRSNKLKPVDDRLSSEGYWFGNAQSDDYGDSVVTSNWIEKNLGALGKVSLLGVAKSEPFQSIVVIEK